jgi:3-hydroxy-9,10-secoandrosta-1,3,5(10)-triene-9,17-dione monooxygenase reductase component
MSAPAVPTVDPVALRRALGTFTTGVTVVTARDPDGREAGVTANSFSSVSLDPPLVLWSLNRRSASLPVFAASSHFAVHILAYDQEALSNRFARPATDKFASLDVKRGAGGAPLLDKVSALFQCRLAYQYDGGDHVILVGEIEDFLATGRPPLVFHGGAYALAARKDAVPSPHDIPLAPDFLGYLIGRCHYQFYGRLQPRLAAMGLSMEDHFIVSALGVAGPLAPADLAAAISYTGIDLSPDRLSAMAESKVLDRDCNGRIGLSPRGRQMFIAAMAAAKDVEQDVLADFAPDEAHLLTQMLSRLVARTDPGLPDLWTQG